VLVTLAAVGSFAPSVFKNFKLTEQLNLQLRMEAFNAFNHPNFAPPSVTLHFPISAEYSRPHRTTKNKFSLR